MKGFMHTLGITEEGLKEDTMPFGKYRGTPIANLSIKYILWLLNNCDFMEDWLETKLKQEMHKHKAELPCYGKFYNAEAKVCQVCEFAEICEELMGEIAVSPTYL